MPVKVAINGFGRIGRMVFRQLFGAEGFEIVAVNDCASPAVLAHLLKYDSVQGRYALADRVEAGEDGLLVDGKTVRAYMCLKDEELPWAELGVDVVLECTGQYLNRERPEMHIDAGAKKVIVSAISDSRPRTIVYGVNEDTLTKNDTIISTGSAMLNALSLMAKALNDYAPIISGVMTAVHAYTAEQKVLDGQHRVCDHIRSARTASANIVPNPTRSAMAVRLVLPELGGKIVGSVHYVPVPAGSCVILTAVVKGRDITVGGVNAAMRSAASECFGYTEEPLVSGDVIGTAYGALFDATQTLVNRIDDDTYQVQAVSWFDNETGYACQMVRALRYFVSLEE